MGSVKRACLGLGVAATISLLVSLVVMMFLFETPQIATWFSASAALAGLAFVSALIAHHFER